MNKINLRALRVLRGKKFSYWLSGILMVFFSMGLFGIDYKITGDINGEEVQEIEEILTSLEKEYLPRFKLDSNCRLKIHVCKDLQEFIKLTGASWWNGGHFRNRTIYLQRLKVLRERGIFQQTLTHEFLHFCIWRAAGNNCSVWFNEGLVLNLSGEASLLDCYNINAKITFPLEDLDQIIRGKDREKAKKAYCQAALLVGRLLRKRGLEKILASLRHLKAGNKRPLAEILE